MPKTPSENRFYAVTAGRNPGVYVTWKECEDQIKNFSRASFKRFRTRSEAETYFNERSHYTIRNLDQSSMTTTTALDSNNPSTKKTFSQRRRERQRQKKQGEPQEAHSSEGNWDVVYTDGACQNNGKVLGAVAGIGAWWGENDPRNISERCPGKQTNNRAELIAIIRVLETHLITKTPLLIKTDSLYSIQWIGVRDWLQNWKRNGWRTSTGEDVKNREIIIYLSELLDERGRQGQPVKFQHVPGHRGFVGNEAADLLARDGISLPHFSRVFG